MHETINNIVSLILHGCINLLHAYTQPLVLNICILFIIANRESEGSVSEKWKSDIFLQIAWEDTRKLAKQRLEREQGKNDAAEDLSELSEGEKEKGDVNVSGAVKEFSRINSDLHIWSDEDNSRNLYIVLIR